VFDKTRKTSSSTEKHCPDND